jgi:hypothetical protein
VVLLGLDLGYVLEAGLLHAFLSALIR